MNEFTSKIDTWLLLVLLITIIVSVFAAIISLAKGGITGIATALFVSALGAVLPAWLLMSTKYIITGDELLVRSGPFSHTIQIGSISSVRDTRNSRSSPALSLDRLLISYGNGQSIMVSPRDKEKFRTAIGHPDI